MAIKLGDKDISKIMLGDRPIKKVYRGEELVWEEQQTNEYIPLQYIVIPTNTQGDFLLDFNPTIEQDNRYRCVLEYAPTSDVIEQNVGAGFCDKDGDNFGVGIGFCSWNSKKYTIWGGSWGTVTSSAVGSTDKRETLELQIQPEQPGNYFLKLVVGRYTTRWGRPNFTISHWGHFHIDGCSKDGSINGEAALAGKWYSFKEYLNGNIVHDYIPAKSKDGEKIGFFDIISKQWVLKSAGNDWEEGPILTD